MRRWAEGALAFIERVAAERGGGLPATARTVALCGVAGTVAYSMIGARPLIPTPYSWFTGVPGRAAALLGVTGDGAASGVVASAPLPVSRLLVPVCGVASELACGVVGAESPLTQVYAGRVGRSACSPTEALVAPVCV